MKNDHLITSVVSIVIAITGLAIIALLVSNNANTAGVLGAISSSVGRMLCVALSPITGGNCGASVSIPDVIIPKKNPTRGTADSTITFCPPDNPNCLPG